MRWRGILVVLGLAAGACVGPVEGMPECVESDVTPGEAYWRPICGGFQGSQTVITMDDAGDLWVSGSVCTDAWVASCDPSCRDGAPPSPRTVEWMGRTFDVVWCSDDGPPLSIVSDAERDDAPSCSDIGAAPTCPDGSAPRCIVVPCDGETYYGPAHPMAGE